MKKLMWVGLLIAAAVLFGCGSDQGSTATVSKYAEIKDVYAKVTDAQDLLAWGLNGASDGKKVASVLKSYTSKMRELSPRLKAAHAEHPELASGTPPAELTSMVDALNASTGKMMSSLSKVQEFLDDPEVTAAMNDLSAAARN